MAQWWQGIMKLGIEHRNLWSCKHLYCGRSVYRTKETPGRAMASSISAGLIRVLRYSVLAHRVFLTAVGPCNATVTHVLGANSSSVTRAAIHMLSQLALSTFRTSPRLKRDTTCTYIGSDVSNEVALFNSVGIGAKCQPLRQISGGWRTQFPDFSLCSQIILRPRINIFFILLYILGNSSCLNYFMSCTALTITIIVRLKICI